MLVESTTNPLLTNRPPATMAFFPSRSIPPTKNGLPASPVGSRLTNVRLPALNARGAVPTLDSSVYWGVSGVYGRRVQDQHPVRLEICHIDPAWRLMHPADRCRSDGHGPDPLVGEPVEVDRRAGAVGVDPSRHRQGSTISEMHELIRATVGGDGRRLRGCHVDELRPLVALVAKVPGPSRNALDTTLPLKVKVFPVATDTSRRSSRTTLPSSSCR